MTELTVQESCSACWLLKRRICRSGKYRSGLCSLRHHCINTIWPYVCNRSLSMLGFHASGFFHVAKMFLQTFCSDKCNYCTYLCIYTSAVRVEQRILLPASARWRFTSPTLVWNVPTLQHYSDVIDYYEQPDLPATSVGHGTCRWKTVRTLSMSVALFGVHSLQMVYHWWVNLNIAAIITKWGLTESEMRRWRRSKNSMISMRFVDEIGQRRDLLHRRATDWQCHS